MQYLYSSCILVVIMYSPSDWVINGQNNKQDCSWRTLNYQSTGNWFCYRLSSTPVPSINVVSTIPEAIKDVLSSNKFHAVIAFIRLHCNLCWVTRIIWVIIYHKEMVQDLRKVAKQWIQADFIWCDFIVAYGPWCIVSCNYMLCIKLSYVAIKFHTKKRPDHFQTPCYGTKNSNSHCIVIRQLSYPYLPQLTIV